MLENLIVIPTAEIIIILYKTIRIKFRNFLSIPDIIQVSTSDIIVMEPFSLDLRCLYLTLRYFPLSRYNIHTFSRRNLIIFHIL